MTDEKEEMYAEWSESDIIEGEVKERMMEIKAGDTELVPHCSKCGGEIDIKGMTDEEIEEWVRNAVYSDDYIIDEAWENFLYDLQELMKKHMDGRGDSYYWYVTGQDLGWRHLSGEKHFQADKAKDLLEGILPKTNQFTLRVYDHKDSIGIACYHHDAPTGEGYNIAPDEVCCVCGYPKEGERSCECFCPTHHDNVFSDPAIEDHHECTDCHKKRLNGEIKEEE